MINVTPLKSFQKFPIGKFFCLQVPPFFREKTVQLRLSPDIFCPRDLNRLFVGDTSHCSLQCCVDCLCRPEDAWFIPKKLGAKNGENGSGFSWILVKNLPGPQNQHMKFMVGTPQNQQKASGGPVDVDVICHVSQEMEVGAFSFRPYGRR